MSAALDELMASVATMGELVTAWPPAKAERDEVLQASVDALLQTYQGLARDAGYVAYLRRFGGALSRGRVVGAVVCVGGGWAPTRAAICGETGRARDV